MITLNSLSINYNNGSDVYLSTECKLLKINTTGGASISIAGNGNKLLINADRGSEINTENYISRICPIKANGGSSVNVCNELYADAFNNSNIGYIGKPSILKLNTIGSSDIYRK
ncbi:MAG: DUF2807 domain-containing protein [Marinilabiliaceae bacterium]|nr:DUF2807 domain-containing protein [Marinilabiliaceae bacterium]